MGTLKTTVLATFFSLAALLGCVASGERITEREPVVGGPCEGCTAVFVNLPSEIPSASSIASIEETGETLIITGRASHLDGSPAEGIVVYAYHTNAGGAYPQDDSIPEGPAVRHGRLRGWAKTDANGNYHFTTIRPGSYPGTSIPQHVHMHVLEPGRCVYYIDDIEFTDDPYLPETRIETARGRGGKAVVTPERNTEGDWVVVRDIVLGQNIPDYPSREPTDK